MINKRRLVVTFKKLVKIDSLSLQEEKIVKLLQKELSRLGYRSFLAGRPREGKVGNLIVNIAGNGVKRPCLLLNAHLDTVSPGKNIKPLEKNGYLSTDGSTILGADNKAGVAAILEVLRVLKEQNLKHPPLQVIFTVAEEIGLLGAKALPQKLLKADFGITLDGGEVEKVIYKAPSQYNLTATVIGKAAHAGIHPEEGINAIKVASEAISRMKLGRIDSETTANIGTIQGGKAVNIVPDEVLLKGEARSHNLAKLDKQLEHMERVLFKTCEKYRARLKLRVERVYKAFEINKKSDLISLVNFAFKASHIQPKLEKTGGGSDANIFNDLGIPTVILGVGADRVHTTREQIKIEDLAKGTENVLNLLKGVQEWKNLKKKK
jgi:tripeptide aminopeptidase